MKHQPLPPTPRTKALRERLAKNEVDLQTSFYEALALCESLEQELGISSGGWKMAEADNIHLQKDNDQLRKVFTNVQKALLSVP